MKTKTLKKIAFFILAALPFVALLAVGFKYDLALDQFLYNPKNALGIWAEVLGWWPLYLGLPLLGFVLLNFVRQNKKAENNALKPNLKVCIPLFCAGIFFTVGGVGALIKPACDYMVKRGFSFFGGSTAVWLIVGLSAVVILIALLVRVSKCVLYKLAGFSAFWIAFMVLENIVINLMKTIWNRTRFDTMLLKGEGFERFTSWLTLAGNGGTSFPSGHTAAAATVLLCVFLCKLFTACKGQERNFVVISYIYIVLVGFGRLIIGRHFLSDVTMATLVVTILTVVLWYLPPVQKYFAKVKEKAESYKK